MNSPRRQWIALLATMFVVSIIWLGVLPWLASQPRVEQRLRFLSDRGIDPSAMYYTELEAMEPILDQLENRSSEETIAGRFGR